MLIMKKISWKRNLAAIWIGQICSTAGTSMTLPFIPIYLRTELGIADDGARAVATSLFFSLGLVSFCASNPIWGALGDKYGRKLMLLRAYFVTAITFPALYFMPNLFWLLTMRFFASMFSGTIAAAQALTAATTPDEHQGFALGVLSSSFWSGNMIGLVAGGVVVHHFGYFVAFMTCGGLFLIGGVLTLLLVEENFVPPIKKAPVSGKKRKFYLPQFGIAGWMLLILMLLIPVARRCDEPFIPFLVENICGKAGVELNTSYVNALAALGGIISGVVFGRLSDRCKPLTLALPALAIAGTCTLLQAFITSLPLLMAARFLIFFAVGGLEPIFLAMLSNTVDADKRGSAFGWSASLRVLGGMLGALIGGGVVAYLGIRSVFILAAAMMLGMLLLLVVCIPFIERCRNKAEN